MEVSARAGQNASDPTLLEELDLGSRHRRVGQRALQANVAATRPDEDPEVAGDRRPGARANAVNMLRRPPTSAGRMIGQRRGCRQTKDSNDSVAAVAAPTTCGSSRPRRRGARHRARTWRWPRLLCVAAAQGSISGGNGDIIRSRRRLDFCEAARACLQAVCTL